MELLVARMTEKRIESDLLAACRRGEQAAFETLYNENQKRVYSIALNFFGGDDQAAKDITQQVFLKIYTRIETFRGDAQLKTWLYRITVNACLDERRKRRRFVFLSDFLGDFLTKKSPDETIHRREIGSAVQAEIARLKPKFRLPILLKYVEGLSYEEIAEILDCSKGTIASRLNRGHKMLASRLGHLKNELQ